MSDVKRYIQKRAAQDAEFADNFEVGYKAFRKWAEMTVQLAQPTLDAAEVFPDVGSMNSASAEIDSADCQP